MSSKTSPGWEWHRVGILFVPLDQLLLFLQHFCSVFHLWTCPIWFFSFRRIEILGKRQSCRQSGLESVPLPIPSSFQYVTLSNSRLYSIWSDINLICNFSIICPSNYILHYLCKQLHPGEICSLSKQLPHLLRVVLSEYSSWVIHVLHVIWSPGFLALPFFDVKYVTWFKASIFQLLTKGFICIHSDILTIYIAREIYFSSGDKLTLVLPHPHPPLDSGLGFSWVGCAVRSMVALLFLE